MSFSPVRQRKPGALIFVAVTVVQILFAAWLAATANSCQSESPFGFKPQPPKAVPRFNGKTSGHKGYVSPDYLYGAKLQPARKVPDLFARAESKDKITSGTKRQKKSSPLFTVKNLNCFSSEPMIVTFSITPPLQVMVDETAKALCVLCPLITRQKPIEMLNPPHLLMNIQEKDRAPPADVGFWLDGRIGCNGRVYFTPHSTASYYFDSRTLACQRTE
ncbi:hypothetical protein F5Y18DRAFT_439658 [Xylariaceae sp. FL1019]|nr:hypothetical protein F5Y18DRAFT_439658 [Xylariaceae sp. FL1019]